MRIATLAGFVAALTGPACTTDDALVEKLRSSASREDRRAARCALRERGVEALPALRRCLRERPYDNVHISCMLMVSELPPENSVPVLLEELQRTEGAEDMRGFRMFLIGTLGKIKATGAEEHLRRLLSLPSTTQRERGYVRWALHEITGEGFAEPLVDPWEDWR